MNSSITIRLQRDLNEKPWGFRLQGFLDLFDLNNKTVFIFRLSRWK